MSDNIIAILLIAALILFVIIFIGIGRIIIYKKQIKKAKEIYTKELKVKCVKTEKLTMAITVKYYNPYLQSNHRSTSATKFIKVDRPTYSCDYAGHNRSFCNRHLDYKPKAVKGGMYTIFLNPLDNKYRDFVDEFYFDARKKMVKNSGIMVAASVIFLIGVCLILYYFS